MKIELTKGVELNINFTLVCAQCGGKIESKYYKVSQYLDVTPCPRCIAEAREEGHIRILASECNDHN